MIQKVLSRKILKNELSVFFLSDWQISFPAPLQLLLLLWCIKLVNFISNLNALFSDICMQLLISCKEYIFPILENDFFQQQYVVIAWLFWIYCFILFFYRKKLRLMK